MSAEAVIAIVFGSLTIGASVLLAAFKIGKHFGNVVDSVDAVTAQVVEVKQSVVELKSKVGRDVQKLDSRLVEFDTANREEQRRQWSLLQQHENRLDEHAERLAWLRTSKPTSEGSTK